MTTGTNILSRASFKVSHIEVASVFAVAITRTGPGCEPLFRETVAIPLRVSTFTDVWPGLFK